MRGDEIKDAYMSFGERANLWNVMVLTFLSCSNIWFNTLSSRITTGIIVLHLFFKDYKWIFWINAEGYTQKYSVLSYLKFDVNTDDETPTTYFPRH